MKTIHFWEAYGISNQKNKVAIYSEPHMAAILQNGCLETGFYQHLSLQIPLCMKYTHFWKAYVWRKKSEKQCCHLSRVLYGRYLAFHNMAAMKQVFVNISDFK